MNDAKRSVCVRAPASSANLGPGFDVLAAALGVHLELTVSDAEEFSLEPGAETRPGADNLCAWAFASICPIENKKFKIVLGMRPARGLGASAAAIVAGLLAADHLAGTNLGQQELFERAVELEGHPDNVAATMFGGFVVCSHSDTGARMPLKLGAPHGLAAVLVVPDERLRTLDARAAIPKAVPLADAVHNVAASCQLILGIERSDPELIARGLEDRLHQPHRADLYPTSMRLVTNAARLGAIGATISGAGPAVMLWCREEEAAAVMERLRDEFGGWGEISNVPFTSVGAEILSETGRQVSDTGRRVSNSGDPISAN